MHYNLFSAYRYPDIPKKVKDYYKPYKAVNMRGGGGSLFIFIRTKDSNKAFKNAENKYSKRQKTESEGHFSALYVIIEVLITPTWTCNLHPTSPNLQFLTPLFNPSPPPPIYVDRKVGQ